jgi:DNA-binding PadR family transcriptional regulator
MAVPKVEVVVLGLLAEESLHGYELWERFGDRGTGSWARVGKASVYQALRRLEGRRFVSGRSQEGVQGPDRRVYRITASGRARLREGLLERFGGSARYEIEASLAFGYAHLLSVGEVRRGIERRVAVVAARRKAIGDERARLAPASGPGNRAALRMLDQQEAFAKAERAWLASFERDLAKLEG